MTLPSTTRTARRVRALEDRLLAARADRDAAIRDRRAEGVGVQQIADEVGLTRQAVYDVLASDNRLDTEGIGA